jgi:phosphatidate cytidylyltransferase
LSLYEIIKNSKNVIFNLIANLILICASISFYLTRGVDTYSFILLWWVLSIVILSDTGGYFFGRIFKGKKLTKISPKKTYSGAYGSLILSITSIPLFNLLQNIFLERLLINFFELKYFIISIIFSLICQAGDLFVSYCKRKVSIKNTGNVLPGHGGILDRIDGLIFVIIFNYLVQKIGLF